MEFINKHGYAIINGKYYRGEWKDDKAVFIEDKKAKEKIEKAKKMAKKLEESLDRKAVLTESIMNLDDIEFETLHRMLTGKRNYKAKTRAHHCVDMKIGKLVIPIVD